MATLKQLAIALNSDIQTTKGILIDYAQQQDKFDFAKEISTSWNSDTELPDWLVEFAESKGLSLERKRTPKKSVNGNGQLANPETVVKAFLTQLPQLITQSLITEQDSFINESRFSGAVTGTAGALAFQKALLESFTQTNQAFRVNRGKGIEAMQKVVGSQFSELYSTFCDTNRQIEEQSVSIQEATDSYMSKLASLQNAIAVTPVTDANEGTGTEGKF